jgi:hypothetical protein
VLDNADTALSPDWWLLRLGRKLRDRRPKLDMWWDYYRGRHPLPEGPKRATEAYRDFQRKARTNFCETIASSSAYRLKAIGIADDQGRSDDQAWKWWQLNKLDARQAQVYRVSLAQSIGYVIVGPHPSDPKRPLITPEHPREVIVEDDPATGERIAAVKAWYDDIERVGRATVYLPDRIVKYATDKRGPGRLPWGRENWTVIGEQRHQLGAVPVVPFPCRPDLGEEPVAEFDGVIDVQDRINFGVLNRMTNERYGAFRQKWVKGHKFRRTRDPETGLETIEQPFVPGPGTVWASEGENTQFGEFNATDLMGYLKTYETDIRTLLVTSATPAYYYAGDLINVSVDMISALDSLHIAKVGEHHANYGEGWEEVLTLSARVAGVDKDMSAYELRWADPRQLNPAVLADAAVKKKSIGYPLAVLAEDLGESPQRVNRITAEAASDALLAALQQPPAQPSPPAAESPAQGGQQPPPSPNGNQPPAPAPAQARA